jgi:hypothetical protein
MINQSSPNKFGCQRAILITVGGMFLGMIAGFFIGNYEVRAIVEEAKRKQPNDPLDMLFFVSVTYIFFGALLGAMIGGIISLAKYSRANWDDNERE